MAKQIRLFDQSFSPDPSTSKYHRSENIEWYRGYESRPVTVFTDLCLALAGVMKNTYKVALLIEPPVINPNTYNFVADHLSHFDLVLSHNKDFVKKIGEKAIWYPFGGSWIAKEDWKIYPKTKNISIVASNKNWALGHQLRHEVIKQSRQDSMDIFGGGYKPIEHKKEALAEYRFSLAIENCQLEGYFTEKLIDCFAVGAVPIYWGDRSTLQYFDPSGVIFCDNKDQMLRVVAHLNEPEKAEILYNNFDVQQSIARNFEIANKYKVAEDYIFTNILQPKGLV